jgi:aryl-alcohol dehydrogenase-like predicted oxidoreductase
MHNTNFGIGTWGLGGTAYGYISRGTVEGILRLARNIDVKFVDTSPGYGSGFCESIIGKLGFFDSALVATKVGLLNHGPRDLVLKSSFTKENLVKSLDSSLERLKCSRLDLLQIDSMSTQDFKKIPSVVKFMEKAKDSGKIAAYGFSLKNPADVGCVMRNSSPSYLQVNFSLMDQRILDNAEFETISRAGVKLIARTPLHFGFLTENFKLDIGRNQHLGNWPKEQLYKWSLRAEEFKKLAHRFDLTIEELAFSFIKTTNLISYVIPGVMSIGQLKCLHRAFQCRLLTPSEFCDVRVLYKDTELPESLISPYLRADKPNS